MSVRETSVRDKEEISSVPDRLTPCKRDVRHEGGSNGRSTDYLNLPRLRHNPIVVNLNL